MQDVAAGTYAAYRNPPLNGMSKAVENAPIECSEKTANPPPLTRQDSAHQGVAKIEATNYALGKKFKYILYVSYVSTSIYACKPAHLKSLALVSLMYAMDVSTTGAYLTFATSSFGKNSLLSSVLVVQYLMSKRSSLYFILL